jgi:hypothetical protein
LKGRNTAEGTAKRWAHDTQNWDDIAGRRQADIRELGKRVLEAADYAVATAADGAEGLHI